jgi:hypothetical protein
METTALECYCWPQSVLQDEHGGTVGLYVSFDGDFEVFVHDACVKDESACVRSLVGTGHHQQTPPEASTHGCKWNRTLDIPTCGLASSLYIVKVVSRDQERQQESLAYFVIRANGPQKSPIICVLSTSTWNAYNDWGGKCLYARATQVSFERPMAKGFLEKPEGSPRKAQPPPGDKEAQYYNNWARANGYSVWSGSSGWWNWERLFCQWARENGMAIDFATSEDLHLRRDLLDTYRAFISVGHDEYWSWEMRDNLDAFRKRGGNICILSGNTCFWQVRFSTDERDRPEDEVASPEMQIKTMFCYKYDADSDPICGTQHEKRVTSGWCDRRIGRLEVSTIGLSFAYGGYSRYGLGVPRGTAAYTVYRPDHWLFEGLGMCFGDSLGASDEIVAYEVDGIPFTMTNGLPECLMDVCGDVLTILAVAPACLWSQFQQPSRYSHEPGELEAVAMSIYGDDWKQHVHKHSANHAVLGVVESNGTAGILINVGVTDWAYGLHDSADGQIKRVTANILRRLLQ